MTDQRQEIIDSMTAVFFEGVNDGKGGRSPAHEDDAEYMAGWSHGLNGLIQIPEESGLIAMDISKKGRSGVVVMKADLVAKTIVEE